ncbi:hypothetical protein KC331_g8984 [Hortaea werneckii]|nr:hypothetical protein KC331_g8984 [Hortaea werneckii]KAI7710732.1 hypothetical protein KC353_g9477 [Hortaea werneckii]
MEDSQQQLGNGSNKDLPDWSLFADMLQGMKAMNLGDASQADNGECPVCREPYDGKSVQPIRLSCCRKPICRACALTWFAPEDQSKSCPRCRTALYRSTEPNTSADYPGLQPLPDLAAFPLDEEDRHRSRLAIDSAPLSWEEGFALQSTARRFAAQPLPAVEESTGFFGYFDRLVPLVRGEDFDFVSESCPIEPEDAETAFTVLRWHLRRDWRPLCNLDGEWPLVDGLRQILLHPASAWVFVQITSFLEEVAEGHHEVEIHLFEEEVFERLQGKMVDVLGRPLVEADLPRGYWDLVQDMLRCAADAMYVGRLVRCSDDGMDGEDEMLYEYDRRRNEDMEAGHL